MQDIILEQQSLPERLATLEILTAKIVKFLLLSTKPLDATYYFSASLPYYVDYKERKRIFILSPTSITISGDLGILITLPASEWVNLGLPAGMRLFAVGQSSPVPLLVRCTEEVIP